MKDITLSLPWMYFTGIQNGDISIIFFDKVPFSKEVSRGDLITFHGFQKKIKTYFDSCKIISFREVTDDIAKKAGFANRDLLADHLIQRLNIEAHNILSHQKIDDVLLYMLIITDDPTFSDGEVDMQMDVLPESMISTTDYSKKCGTKCWTNNLTLNDKYTCL